MSGSAHSESSLSIRQISQTSCFLGTAGRNAVNVVSHQEQHLVLFVSLCLSRALTLVAQRMRIATLPHGTNFPVKGLRHLEIQSSTLWCQAHGRNGRNQKASYANRREDFLGDSEDANIFGQISFPKHQRACQSDTWKALFLLRAAHTTISLILCLVSTPCSFTRT